MLHGNRQTGDLLLGRMAKLKRNLARSDPFVELVAPDAPFLVDGDASDNGDAADSQMQQDIGNGLDSGATLLRTWWHRHRNEYVGLEQSLNLLRDMWSSEGGSFCGIFGFSQGARLAHLVALLHTASNRILFPGLQYVILASGYGDVPLPINLLPTGPPWDDALGNYTFQELSTMRIYLPSLHLMGLKDGLIPVESSRSLLDAYIDPIIHEHPGGHHVPMQSAVVDVYVRFILEASTQSFMGLNGPDEKVPMPIPIPMPDSNADGQASDMKEVEAASNDETSQNGPDEEHAQIQQDECESLAMIFPDEFILHSQIVNESGEVINIGREDMEAGLLGGGNEERRFVHPISYAIKLRPSSDQDVDEALWPPDDSLALRVTYPPEYPDVLPRLSLDHRMNLLEFKDGQEQACFKAIQSVAKDEAGMPSVMGCVYAGRDFFESGGMAVASANFYPADNGLIEKSPGTPKGTKETPSDTTGNILVPASLERIAECNLQGLEIANSVLGHPHPSADTELPTWLDHRGDAMAEGARSSGKGGQWRYTIGLVGKPSAGKSTFFNAATAFARQRGADVYNYSKSGVTLGGATMAPHPFTTIDPNVGYCLVPAPPGSCPEDDEGIEKNGLSIGSTHGRDNKGRRLLPVMLKDVAGLVPGAYQGRGKGNKFLDDLTDADVLIHVVDASGTSDTEGNTIVLNDDDDDGDSGHDSETKSGAGSHPLDDLNWIRNELLEWVYSNLAAKWDTISRKGRNRLCSMFSGYRQSQAFVYDVLVEVERYVERNEGRDHVLDQLDSWDAGDVHRLVSAFLGVRFPMALALNKSDLPSAAQYVQDVRNALPIHGAHVGIPLCAKSEMTFVRNSIMKALNPGTSTSTDTAVVPEGVWDTLQSAMRLREPILVFPVADMSSYEPISGMNEYASCHASLPNSGMISCLSSAGGKGPSLWNSERHQYIASDQGKNNDALRDVLVMKNGSTVEDVFLVLKSMGALGGEFVRAEGAGRIGEQSKLVKKDDSLGKNNRILKIMTNKRTKWQIGLQSIRS